MHTYMHACMHAYTYIHAHTYVHIHTHKYVRAYHIHTSMHDKDGYEDVDPSKTTVVRGEPGEDFARKSEIGAFAGRAVDEVCLCLFILARLPFSIFDYLWVCLSLCLSSPLSLYGLTTTAIMPARAWEVAVKSGGYFFFRKISSFRKTYFWPWLSLMYILRDSYVIVTWMNGWMDRQARTHTQVPLNEEDLPEGWRKNSANLAVTDAILVW